MRWFSLLAIFLTTSLALAQNGPKNSSLTSPLSPEESLKHLVLADPNLVIEIVAAEPEVIDPVSMQFDEHGRLWVVEMRDYPTGPKNAPPPLGGPEAKPLSRIKLLEDKDGDGRFETAHVFAENLLFATGVQPWDGGVIVTHSGEIVYLKDTDGDHKADVREVWFTGFSEQNTQLRANHPTFGPDGWIYVANGLRGGNVIAVKKDWPSRLGFPARPDGETKNEGSGKNAQPTGVSHDPQNPVPVSLTGRDFKFDPLTGRYEAISGNGQHGMTFDAWGNRFVCDNRHPCRHVIFEEDFIRRCPHVAFPAVVHDVIPPDDKNKVFPLTSAWTTSNLHAGTFTASCGVCVYTGDWLPAEFRGNVFVCEPTGNLVQRAVLEPDGVTFKSRNPHERSPHAPREDQPNASSTSANKSTSNSQSTSTVRSADLTRNVRATLGDDTQEFLASRDDWFRPVDLQNGPDGALYVVDMYRAVIEHPEWVPDELKKRPDTWLGNDMGRIYRIRPKAAVIPFHLGAEWWRDGVGVRAVSGWHQSTWNRKWREQVRGDIKLDATTTVMAMSDKDARARAKFAGDVIKQTAGSPPGSSDFKELLMTWANDKDARVRFQAIIGLSLASPDDRQFGLKFAELALQDAHDPWIRQAVLAVGSDDSNRLLARVLSQLQKSPELWQRLGLAELIAALSESVGSKPENRESVPGYEINRTFIALTDSFKDAPPQRADAIVAGMIGLATGAAKRGVPLITSLDAQVKELRKKHSTQDGESEPEMKLVRAHQKLDALFLYATNLLTTRRSETSLDQQRLALRMLRLAPFINAGSIVQRLAETNDDQSVRFAAVETFASFHKPEVDVWLIERYRSETPAIRRAILAALLASKERQLRLLEAVEKGEIAATELNPTQANQLTQSKDETVRERAKTILAAAAPASRKEVLEAYQPALSLTGDAKRGRELFVKNCSTCHRVDNVGVDVAPNISDTRTKKPEQLLLDILDPNKAIDANYFAYSVVTKDGQAQSGVIASESANSITLKQPEGKTVTLLRADIDELKNTGLSLMPVGLEKNLDQQAIADLIFWLKNWRYLDGKVPATSLK